MNGKRLVGSWLIGLGAAMMTLALVRGEFGSLAFPFLVSALGLLLFTHQGRAAPRFPGTDLERSLDRLFALLLPARKATTAATARLAMAQQIRLAQLRRGTRRWANELQLLTTDGYETASRISARHLHTSEQDDRALVDEAVEALRANRSRAGADLSVANDPVSMLAYGLGARPTGTDLTSLEDLLWDLGFSEEGDELRTHFDDVLDASSATNPQLRNETERGLFRELAGASFVLGASARIVELVSLSPPDRPIPVALGR